VDATLSQTEAAEVAAHLAECDPCRETVADLIAVRNLLAGISTPGAHPSLLPRTLARLPQARRRRTSLAPRVVAAGAAVLLLSVGMQVRLPGRMGAQARNWLFQSHAQIASAHPMADLALSSYLGTSLPYTLDLEDSETGGSR